MGKVKKITSLLLIFSILISIVAPLSNASSEGGNDVKFTLTSNATQLVVGEEIEVIMNLELLNDAQINGLDLMVNYDSDVLELGYDEVEKEEKLYTVASGRWSNPTFSNENGIIHIVSDRDSKYSSKSGPIFTLTFKVIKAVKTTTISIDNVTCSYVADLVEADGGELQIPKVQDVFTINYYPNTTETVANMPTTSGSKVENIDYPLASAPIRTGYTFKEWNTNSDGTGTAYAAGANYTDNADLELYAIWTPIMSMLTINPNGGTWNESTEPKEFEGQYGTTKSISAPTETPEGFTVVFNENGGQADTLRKVQTTTFDKWELTGGGSFDETTSTYTYADTTAVLKAKYIGNSITLPGASKIGSTFNGWYTSSIGGTRVGGPGEEYTPTTTMNLYAQWNEDEYTLTINPNLGTYNGTTSNSTETGTYNSTTAITNPVAPKGYTVTLNDNGATTPLEQNMTFDRWILTGKGSMEGIVYRFGEGDGTLTANYIANSIDLPTLEKTGYIFDGWYTQANGGTKIETPYTPTANVTLYAHWTPEKYTIKFDPGTEGTVNTPSKEVTYGEEYGTLPTPEKPGYDFDGWEDEDGNKITKDDIVNITDDKTLIATWLGAEYTVTFNANGGNLGSQAQSKTVRNEGKYGELPTPEKQGYTFVGWYDSEDRKIESTTTVGLVEDTTLIAKWDVIKSKLTVDPNEGTWEGSTEPKDFEGEYETTKTILAPTIAPDGFVVNFNANGGIVAEESITQTQRFDRWELTGGGNFVETTYTFADTDGTLTAQYIGENITLPSVTKSGAIFKGWFTDLAEETKVGDENESYMPTANITLYAKWEEEEYTLTINPNLGIYNGKTENTTEKGAYNSTITITNPTAPSGYTVTLNNNGEITSIVQEMTFDRWELTGKGNIVGVVYTFGDGDGTITANYIANSVELPTLEKTGYTFDGWFTQANGGTKIETPYTPIANVTLYAHWTPEKYTIKFDPGTEGTVNTPSKEVTYGEEYGTLPTPTRDGYDFDGWEDEDGNKITEDDIVNITDDKTLIATWLGAEYTVTFNADGGDLGNQPSSKTVRNEGTYGELPIPEKQGYTFIGWYNSNNDKIESITKVELTSDETLNAKYAKNKYTVTFTNDDGSIISTSEVEYGDNVTYTGTTPEKQNKRPGYEVTFNGWTNQEKLLNVVENITVQAVYTEIPIVYTITYNNLKNSDNLQNPSTYTVEDEIIMLKPLTNQGRFVFDGWYINNGTESELITSIDTKNLGNITLYAKWTEDKLYLESPKYKIGENNIDKYEVNDVYIDKIEPETTVAQFKENCETNGDITVINDGIELSDEDFVGTNMTIKVTRFDETITLTAIVMGDADGNGKITATDLSSLNQAILKTKAIDDTAVFKALDLDDNGRLTATDLSTEIKAFFGMKLIYNKSNKND